jgi:hypothetical protein
LGLHSSSTKLRISDDSGGPAPSVQLASQSHALTVGKPRRQIVQSLDQKEKEYLQQLVQEEMERYEQEINRKYHDKYKCKSIYFNVM